MVTLKEIAERCQCSVATVSKALNGKNDINRETGEAIRKAAKEMGYVPNMAARALKTNCSRTIGLMWFLRDESVWTHDHFGRIAYGIQSVAESHGYDVTPVSCTPENLEGHYLEYCRTRGYDGLVLMNAGYFGNSLMELINSDIPMVTIDFAFPHRGAVMSDQEAGQEALVRAAWEMGHRRIAFIHGEMDNSVSYNRCSAFYRTCADLGVEIPKDYVLTGVYCNGDLAYKLTERLLALPQRPTCILYPDDVPAAAGLRCLLDHGLRVPQDISIAGYDGIRLASRITPRLTTYVQDGFQMGVAAAELLMELMRNPDSFIAQHITVPGRLEIGETMAPPRA